MTFNAQQQSYTHQQQHGSYYSPQPQSQPQPQHYGQVYEQYPAPIPTSPLKTSPLATYPPFTRVGVPQQQAPPSIAPPSPSSSSSSVAQVKTRGFEECQGSDSVYSPYYNSRMSYQAVTDMNNSLAPLAGVHLFHHPDSVDSMKARMVLEEKGVTWNSDIINTPQNQQLEAEYVSMNPRGTIPTLIVDNRVTTDGRNIVNYVNHTFPGPNLVPANEREVEVMEHFVDLTDKQNVEAMTFGKVSGVKKRTFKSPYAKRRIACANHSATHASNRNLVEAYKQKSAVIDYQDDIVSSPDRMKAVFGNVQAYLAEVEGQLTNGPFAYGGWLASDIFTLADIHVLCFLRFLDILDLSAMFGHNTQRYYMQGKNRNSFLVAGEAWTSAYGRVKNHYMADVAKNSKKFMIPLLAIIGGVILSLLTWGGFRLFKNRKPKQPVEEIVVVPFEPVVEVTNLRGAESIIEEGTSAAWKKWILMILPAMASIPFFLWLCGCIKCKKRHGRSRPKRAVVKAGSESGSMKIKAGSHSSNSGKKRRRSSSSVGNGAVGAAATAAVASSSSSSSKVKVVKASSSSSSVKNSSGRRQLKRSSSSD